VTDGSPRDTANAEALSRLREAEPVLIDVQPAIDVLPHMTPLTILTSGPPMEWHEYIGGQRRAIIAGALFEGLASSEEEADKRIRLREITLGACHDYGCVGSVAGIYTASMPVFVVENRTRSNLGFCNFYEGKSLRRLNYGAYDEQVRQGLLFLQNTVAPTIGEAIRRSGGIRLKSIMQRALHMGDELHSRNAAATLLFSREVFPHLLEIARDRPSEVRDTLQYMAESDYFFLRLSMASAKAMADAAHGIEHSSVVTAMTMSCQGTAVRVSGLPDTWFRGPHGSVDAKLFSPFTKDDIEWIGGESLIAETVGFGGFAQAAAFPLQNYQGGSPEAMANMNLSMYEITVGEHTDFRIPYFCYRGTPVGIDIYRVVDTGILPVCDVGLAGKDGGQIGAGILRIPLDCFETAREAFESRENGRTAVVTDV